ncbi:MAG: hypothetical protein DSY50_01885 [Desulfobulbus sp.]|nr:MAG: hypothetical protein DSY58_08800 [Desulfobulbus sp.]RUM36709.1 MAG: hypothetical protein DSY50_01885 [Desulfobulbus sp.]
MKINKKRVTRQGVILAVMLLSLAFGGQLFGRSGSHKWSKTTPEINLGHIFEGAINSRGRPTGFHSRPNGKDPRYARLKRIKGRPNHSGVYTAEIEVYDPRAKKWKKKFSTLFPDSMSREQVVKTILYAWKHRKSGKSKKWEGPSGKGFPIQGYLNKRGNINTAYPVYIKNR